MKKLVAMILAFAMLFAVACVPKDQPSADPNGDDHKTGNVYNIIFALASIPPVLAALDSIDSGYETYAIIERGKTYSGIDSLEYFHNVGFDPANNLSTGFTSAEFNAMVAKVKELRESDENAFFNFYVQDGTALRGAAIAANAGLDENDFHIYMCEDGTGAYHALYDKYIKDKTLDADTDEVYDGYVEKVKEAESVFKKIMGKDDNKNGDADLKYNIGLAFALAALDNFTYYLQDEAWINDILDSAGNTRLVDAFEGEGDPEYALNLKYQKISDGIAGLTEKEKTDYLTLMYGQYYEDTYSALTRTERAREDAPEKKLVFIGARHNGYPKFASGDDFSIGGLSSMDVEGVIYYDQLPESYDELSYKYKSDILFSCEEDYNIFLSVMEDLGNYSHDWAKIPQTIRVAAFNIYIDYMFTMKLVYSLYGDSYDIIVKGHPREALGCYEEWGNRYKYKAESGEEYVYDKLIDALITAFHESDSTGKYIGTVPYGTAAENLAYLGADIAIGGLPSSTYNGFDTDVDVLFVLAETDEDIVGSGKDEAASQVKARFEAGNLKYTDTDGEKQDTVFLNTGNVYKAVMEITENSDGEYTWPIESMELKFKAWLNKVYGEDVSDIDAQGFAKTDQE